MADPEKSTVPDQAPDIEKTAPVNEPEHVDGAFMKHVDRNDADEAYKIFAGHEGETILMTPLEEKKLLRKIDRNLMPLLCIVYGLNYLDKTTVSYASIMGLKVCFHQRVRYFGIT
jgi:ACS family allantoate permease-like MFS transporter